MHIVSSDRGQWSMPGLETGCRKTPVGPRSGAPSLLAQRKWCDERIVTRYSCQRIGLQMRLVIRLCSVLWIALASLPIRAVAAAATPVRQSFDISVPFKPSAVIVDGKTRLMYELHLTNFAEGPLSLDSVTVSSVGGAASLARWSGAALARRTGIVGQAASPGENARADARVVGAGQRAIVWLEVDVGKPTPRRLTHVIGYGAGNPPTRATVADAGVDVRSASDAALSPPLAGGPWVAIYSPEWPRGHRRVFYTVGGRAILPGRFAIDWVRADDKGRITVGDPDKVSSFLGYAADVLAVADARVVDVRDTIEEAATVSGNAAHELSEAAGNFVVLALQDGRFAIYEHLRRGSIKVRVNDTVRRGQVIAQLGFSGQSTGPHLHFHVADRPGPLIGDGVSYSFERFVSLGRYDDGAALGMRPWQARDPNSTAERRMELPPSYGVVQFAP